MFTDILMRELGLSRVQLSAAYRAGTVLSGLALPWLGRYFDRIGARKMVVGASVATGWILTVVWVRCRSACPTDSREATN